MNTRALPPHGPVPSPCTDVCRMSAANDLCEGCLRTLDEIAAWSTMADGAKRVLWAELEQRRARIARPTPSPSPSPSPP